MNGGGVGLGSVGGSVCPHFDEAFLRNLQILTRDQSKYACLQQQLANHPCKRHSAKVCRDGFVAAMV